MADDKGNLATRIFGRIRARFAPDELSLKISDRQLGRWVDGGVNPPPESAKAVARDLWEKIHAEKRQKMAEEVFKIIREEAPKTSPEQWTGAEAAEWFFDRAKEAREKEKEEQKTVEPPSPPPSPPGDSDPITPEKRRESVRRALQRFRTQGLESAIAFSPRHDQDLDLASFCVPARVITEEEWAGLIGGVGPSGTTLTDALETLLVRRSTGVWLNGWLQRAHRRVVLKGEPGQGKTTALWLYAAELCQTGMEQLAGGELPESAEAWRMPLFLPLSRIPEDVDSSRSVTEFAVDYLLALAALSAADAAVIRGWLRGLIEQGRVTLLLDALDEMPEGACSWLQTQLAARPDVPVVLTTRYHADPRTVLRRFTVLRMVPLRWWVIDDFVTRFFTSHPGGTRLANEVRRTLRQTPKLRQLAQNPLLLGVICHLKSDDESAALPASRAGLLGAALGAVLARGDRKRKFNQARSLRDKAKTAVLAEVAWHFQERRARPMDRLALLGVLERERPTITQDQPPTAEALLSEFLQDGVLVRRGQGPYGFMLRRLHEYALAHRVASLTEGQAGATAGFSRLVRGRAEGWGRSADWAGFRPLNQPGWWEVWPLVAGMGEGNEAMVQALLTEWESAEDLVASRLRLLVAALGEFVEVRRQHGARVREEWSLLAARLTGPVLDLAAGEPAVTDFPHSWRVSLTQLPPETVLPELARRLDSQRLDPRNRNSYLIALGEIGTTAACLRLRGIVEDHDADQEIRAMCAIALGLVGDAHSREMLLLWLERSRKNLQTLHFGCISGLAQVADAPSRTALADLLKTAPNAAARWQCIQECERLFGPEIEQELMGLLERFASGSRDAHESAEDVDGTLQKCAEILGRIGSPASARRMLALLSKPLSGRVKRRLCAAIADAGDSESRHALRDLVLKPGPDRRLENFAAMALIRVGDEELLPRLLEVSTDPRLPQWLLIAAVEACQECPVRLVTDFLLDRVLKDRSEEVKIAAARALLGRELETVAEPLTQALRGKLSEDVRFECAFALAASGSAEADKWLVQALEKRDGKSTTRVLAVRGLSWSQSEEARESLRRAATDPDEEQPIRVRCLDALRGIQQQQGWRPLRSGGWDAP